MRQIVLISGRLRTGRTGLAKELKKEFGYSLLKTSKLLAKHANKEGSPSDSAVKGLWRWCEDQCRRPDLVPTNPLTSDLASVNNTLN